MRLFFGIIAMIPIFTWLIVKKNYSDSLGAANLFSILYAINIAVPIFIYSNLTTASNISTPYIRDAVMDEKIYIEYILLQTLCYYMVLFGMKLRIGKSIPIQYIPIESEDYDENIDFSLNAKYRIIGFALWAIGCFAFLMIMNQVGGVIYFFTHLQYRVSLTRHIDFWSWILPFVNYGTLFVVYSLKGTGKKFSIWLVLLILVSGFMSGLGGRKAMIILFIEAMLLYHYTVKSLRMKEFLKLKYVVLAFALYLFFILMKSFRIEGAVELFLSNPIEFISAENGGIINVIRSESYVTYYMSVIKYFKSNSYWMGRSFLGLVTAIIPSSLFAGKPPVDDGAYLYSIVQGRSDIIPPMKFSELNGSSLPLETFGSMFANFGVIGLFVGMIILGAIYSKAYRNMQQKSYSLFSVVMYTQVLFTFQLSTLRIFQTFEMAVVLWGVTFFVEHISSKKNYC